jgi:hypothetical protein
MITGYLFWGRMIAERSRPNWIQLYMGQSKLPHRWRNRIRFPWNEGPRLSQFISAKTAAPRLAFGANMLK